MPMTVSTFVHPKRKTAWVLKVDVPNRRVVTLAGKIGLPGRKTTRVFGDTDEVRDFADDILDKKLDAGFVQVA